MNQPASPAPSRILFVAAPGAARETTRALLAQAGHLVVEASSLGEAQRELSVAPERIEALSAGADDSIDRSCGGPELLARVRALLRQKSAHDRVRLARGELERLVTTDTLTGLYNRRGLLERLKIEIERYHRHRQPFALAMLDLDSFKPINDEHGHLFGDLVLRAIGERMLRSVRTLDTAARFGGDEFALILPQTDAAGAQRVCERILRAVSALEISHGGVSVRATMSLGLAFLPSEGIATAEELLDAADIALYRAKRAGRNRVALSAAWPAASAKPASA